MAFFETYSYKKGAALSIGSTFVWKILSFVNSILIAFYFGTQTNCDIYFYILYIVGITAVFFSSLSSNVLIPQTIHLRKQNEQQAQSFLNFILLSYIILILITLLFGFIFPVDIFSLISKFSAEILSQDILILKLAFLYTCIYILCSFILDIMYVYHIFSINFLFPFNALIPMITLILFHKTLGLKSMLIGFIISYSIQIIVCLFIMKKKLNWSFKYFKISLESRLKNNIITNQILLITNFINSIIPVYLLSNFGSIISSLSYAKQLTDAPTEIITSKIVGIYNIQLNENAAAKDFTALNTNYLKVTYIILFIITPLCLFTCYFAPDIVNLFFKRGEFNIESSTNVVKFLRPLMLLMLINGLTILTNSLIASTRKIKESFKYILVQNLINITIISTLLPLLGPFSFPYIQILCVIIYYFMLALFFKIHIPQINYWRPLKDAFILITLNLLALIPAGLAGFALERQNLFIKIFVCGMIFLFTLALLYLPSKQFKKILPFILGAHYKFFTDKLPHPLKQFLI